MMKHLVIALTLLTTSVMGAGEKHTVVPATRGNTLELEVGNRTGTPMENLTTRIISKPLWITIANQDNTVPVLMPDSTVVMALRFDIGSGVGAGKEDSIVIEITAGDGPIARHSTSIVVEVPREYALSQNYPNPFNPATKINFTLPHQSAVRQTIFNVLGQQIATVMDDVREAGYYSVPWDGTNSTGTKVGSGVYFYRMDAHAVDGNQRYQHVKKMLVVK